MNRDIQGRTQVSRLVPPPEQNTPSQGVPAISAARIVGDHNMSRLATSCSFLAYPVYTHIHQC
jgi:hypothetical protein